jgi:hypothetical protein
MPVVFDTLAYARRLADAGVPEKQAEMTLATVGAISAVVKLL